MGRDLFPGLGVLRPNQIATPGFAGLAMTIHFVA
jgi:hypothetical protein